jgi:hypothetical protein
MVNIGYRILGGGPSYDFLFFLRWKSKRRLKNRNTFPRARIVQFSYNQKISFKDLHPAIKKCVAMALLGVGYPRNYKFQKSDFY